jgi:hypothetical protein
LDSALIKSFELEDKNGNTQNSNLKEPIVVLKQWNFYATENLVEDLTLANEGL